MYPLFGVLFVSLSVMGLDQSDSNTYGPYYAEWESFETCKGPKRTECGVFKIASKSNMSDVVFAINLAKDCLVTRARITTAVRNKKNNSTRILFNYGLGSPCQHFVFGPVLKDAFNITNSCKINKGSYEIHVNMHQKSLAFLGKNFFYGTYVYKMIVHNDQDNFFCVQAIFKAVKLTNKNEVRTIL